jgi:demethylmenaquinone methyltransferase/2-methoxy-6-polyprenyl-1,4-benzoquinol methylase
MSAAEESFNSEATQANYDRLSRWYDLLSGPAERKHRLAAVERLRLLPGERALEIGYGTGQALQALARQVGEQGEVVGLDLSLGMAAVSGARLHRAGLTSRVHRCCGDARWLPFAGGFCDAVLLCFTLELFSERDGARVLAECWRALKWAGRLGVVSLAKPPQAQWGVTIYEWFQRHFPQVIDCRPIPVGSWVARAGFQVVGTQGSLLAGFLPLEFVLARKGPPA